jgi:hypothetical protein
MRGLAFTHIENSAILVNKRPSPVLIHTFFISCPLEIKAYGKCGLLIKHIKKMEPWRIKFIWDKVYFIIERKIEGDIQDEYKI